MRAELLEYVGFVGALFVVCGENIKYIGSVEGRKLGKQIRDFLNDYALNKVGKDVEGGSREVEGGGPSILSRVYSDGVLFQCTCLDGKQHGLELYFNPESKRLIMTMYVEGKQHGPRVWIWNLGEDDQRFSSWTGIYENGSKKQGSTFAQAVEALIPLLPEQGLPLVSEKKRNTKKIITKTKTKTKQRK